MISFSRIVDRPCAQCGAPVHAVIWFILDRDERPALWLRCQTGKIHHAVCANGHQGAFRINLLLCHRSIRLLLFSPGENLDSVEVQSELLGLQHRLHSQPGMEDANQYRKELIPRDMLPGVLNMLESEFFDFAPDFSAPDEAQSIADLIHNPDSDLKTAAATTPRPEIRALFERELALRSARSGDIEMAIQLNDRLLDVFPKNRHAKLWGIIQSDLASLYQKRDSGQKELNLSKALRHSDLALEVLKADNYPEEYALLNSIRGNILADLAGQDISALSKALEAYKAALDIYDQASYPDDWAQVEMNRGTVFQQIGGPENIEKAVKSFTHALTVRTRDRSLYNWALVQMNLGASLLSLSYRDKTKVPETVSAFRNALSGLETDPYYRAATLYNLSLALKLSGTKEDLVEAARSLQVASAICKQQKNFVLLRQVNDTLSEILFKRLDAEKIAEQRLAVVHAAFEYLSAETESNEVADLFFKIGQDLCREPITLIDDQVQLAEKAVKHALLIWRKPTDLVDRAAGLATLGSIYQHPYFIRRANGRSASETCLNQALDILRSLEQTPERLVFMNSIYSLLEINKINKSK